jgi:hypothetical protein
MGLILSGSRGLCQTSPYHGDIPRGSFVAGSSPSHSWSGALFQPLDIHIRSSDPLNRILEGATFRRVHHISEECGLSALFW